MVWIVLRWLIVMVTWWGCLIMLRWQDDMGCVRGCVSIICCYGYMLDNCNTDWCEDDVGCAYNYKINLKVSEFRKFTICGNLNVNYPHQNHFSERVLYELVRADIDKKYGDIHARKLSSWFWLIFLPLWSLKNLYQF